jgi:hypothetical protein
LFLRFRRQITVAIAFAVPLVVLLATVRTSVGFWDTADLQTVAWIAGIPYPTGFPLYVVIGWIWTHALPIASVAARLNALSAVAIAVGAATVCAIALMLDVTAILAVLAGWTFALAAPVWIRGTYADVHPVGFAVAFVALALAVRWVVTGDPRARTAAILVAAVAVGIDNTTVLILAGVVVVGLGRRLPVRSTAVAFAGAVAIVCAAYAWLPLRSAQVFALRLDPTLDLGVPAGRPFWDDHHPSSYDGFIELVGGTAWSPQSSLGRLATSDAIGAAVQRYGPHLTYDFPFGLSYVALIGGALVARRRPLVAGGLALVGVVPALFGASYPVEADPGRYAFALYAVTALGIAVAADGAVRLARGPLATPARYVVALALLALVGFDLTHGGDLWSQRGDIGATMLGDEVTSFTRDGAVVVTPWNYATPLAYRAYVERAFGTRIVLCGNPADYDAEHYAAWLRNREVVIVTQGEPEVPGFHTRLIAPGNPSVYEVVP